MKELFSPVIGTNSNMQTTPFALQPDNGYSYPVLEDKQQKMAWAAIGVLVTAMLYAYWNMFQRISEAWDSPQYSHGWLIPVFAAVLIYLRREPFCGPGHLLHDALRPRGRIG